MVGKISRQQAFVNRAQIGLIRGWIDAKSVGRTRQAQGIKPDLIRRERHTATFPGQLALGSDARAGGADDSVVHLAAPDFRVQRFAECKGRGRRFCRREILHQIQHPGGENPLPGQVAGKFAGRKIQQQRGAEPVT